MANQAQDEIHRAPPSVVNVFREIQLLAGSRGECSPSIRDLAQFTNYSKPSVLKALRRLASSGLLAITPQFADDGGRAPNLYKLRG
jgi:Mn-dependent DtxR family transcriptional regulator